MLRKYSSFLLFFGFTFFVFLSGCDDTNEPSQAPGRLIESPFSAHEVPGLWRPAGMAVSPEGVLYIAEQATGRIRSFSVSGELLNVIVEPWTGDLDDTTPTWTHLDLDWGLGLISIDSDTLLVAGPGHPAILIDIKGDVSPQRLGRPVGKGIVPAEGVRLSALDLSLLSGLEEIPGSQDLLIVLNHQIWRIERAPDTKLADATLHLLAGNGHPSRGASSGVASSTSLALEHWVGMAPHPDGGVFFIEGTDRIRFVSDDNRIIVVAGEGNLRGFQEGGFDLDIFACIFEPKTRLRWNPQDQRLYTSDRDTIFSVTIDSIDLDGGTAQGKIHTLQSSFDELGDLLVDPNGRFFLNLGFTGSLAEWNPQTLELTTLFGPELIDEELNAYNSDRFNLNTIEPYSSRHDPYRLKTLLSPQAVTPLFGPDLLLVSMPLARGLMVVSRSGSNATAEEFLYQGLPTIGGLGWRIIAGDPSHPGRFFISDGSTLILAEVAEDSISGFPVVTFLRPREDGLPGSGLDAILRHQEMSLRAGIGRLIFFDQNQYSLFDFNLKNRWIDLLTGLWFKGQPLGESGSIYISSLDLSEMSAWDVSRSEEDWRLVAIPNAEGPGDVIAAGASQTDMNIAGTQAPRRSFTLIAGGGETPLGLDGTPEATLNAKNTYFEHIYAIDYIDTPEGQDDQALIAFSSATDRAPQLAKLEPGPDGTPTLQVIPGPCGELQIFPSRIFALDTDAQSFLIWSLDGMFACTTLQEGLTVAGVPLSQGIWKIIHQGSSIPPSVSPERQQIASIQRGLLFIESWGDAPAPLPNGETLPPEDLFLSVTLDPNGIIYLSRSTNEGREIVATLAPEVSSSDAAPFPEWPTLEVVIGGGTGLGDNVPTDELRPGRLPSAAATSPNEGVYLSMLDTQSLWLLDTASADNPDTQDTAHLLANGPSIFSEKQAFAPLTADEGGVWIGGYDRVSYVTNEGDVSLVAGGGNTPPTEGAHAEEVLFDEVIGLASEQGSLYILTRASLLEVTPDGLIHMLSEDGAIILPNGERRGLGFTPFAQPPLSIGHPGELLMAYPPTHAILNIPISH